MQNLPDFSCTDKSDDITTLDMSVWERLQLTELNSISDLQRVEKMQIPI